MVDKCVNTAAPALDLVVGFPFPLSLKIQNPILAGFISAGALALGAYYLANKLSSERAIRNALEKRNEVDAIDPQVGNIEQGSVLVDLHCYSEKSFLEFVKDFEADKVRHRLEEEFTKIGFCHDLHVTIRNADEVYRKVKEIRPTWKSSRAEKIEDKEILKAGDASVVCSSPNLSSFQEGQRAASKRMTSEALTSSEVLQSTCMGSTQGEPHTSKKRTASEVFTSKGADSFTMSDDGEEETGFKLGKLEEVSGDETCGVMEAANGEFSADVVFALDYSSSVTEEELKKEMNFVQHLAQSWNLTTECSKAALVVYGHDSQTVIPFSPNEGKLFSDKLGELKTKALIQGKCRRMDLALQEAAANLTAKVAGQTQYQLVIMITAGKQLSGEEGKEDSHDLISSSELLYSRNVNVIIVPVGLETDFKELGLIVKRPQSLFPLSSFDDLTQARAQEIASHIYQTIDNDDYAKRTLYTFAAIPTESTLWEKISLCSDVMEGAWYLQYEDHKKSSRQNKTKKLIRKSIDYFHGKLVSDSKICISLAVFGPLGAGKSFILNFVLNQGLPEMHQVEQGPLPSASGGSCTPLPINIKWGNKVQVFLYKQEKNTTPDVWFPEEDLDIGTLARVHQLLEMKFKDEGNFSDAKCVELQGPFPVFKDLKERSMTTSGHLVLEVDVEFVDIPGRGDEKGNHSIDKELSNADVVLFFEEGKSGRPVSSEDIAHIFRRLEEVQFISRPKLVHLVNDRTKPSSVSSCDFGWLREQKREDLRRAWSSFLSSSIEQGNRPGCYKDVREKLPQLNGEALLDKLSKESDVIYFHPESSDFLASLKNVINDHVQNVKIKETIHPFLKNVHWAAKTLRTRIGRSLYAEKKKNQPGKIEVKVPNFEMQLDVDQVRSAVKKFMDKQRLPLQGDISQIYCFLDSEETLAVLLDSLKVSLDIFRLTLIEHFKNVYWSTSPDISDLVDLVESLCESRVVQYCANNAQTYLLYVVEKEKNLNPLKRLEKRWSSAVPEKRANLCVDFLYHLLNRIAVSLNKPTRDKKKEEKKSHFHLIEQLKEDVKDLFAVGSLDNASRPDLLKLLNKKLQTVIEFCTKSICEINPHPSLDVETDISLPEEMKETTNSKAIPLRPNYDAIIKYVTDLFKKPGFKGSDAIHKLKSKLNVGNDALVLRQPQSEEKQRLWAKSLINVLSDKNHFNIQLDPRLTLEHRDPEIEEFLKEARKRLFAYEKSSITCKIVPGQALPDNEIHLKKSSQGGFCIEVLVSSEMSKKLEGIRNGLVDPMQQIVPIFMPTVRCGPSREMRGNFFLEEDPWSRDVRTDDLEQEQSETGEKGVTAEKRSNVLDVNIFLVVEEQHLKTVQSTVIDLKVPKGRNISYVVLPQKGRGIGVTRAIIKSLAECLDFSLYWTIDDDVQFMYQFDENDRKWHKCSLTRGLLFGQRVFQTCLKKTAKELSEDEKFALLNELMPNCPDHKTRQKATVLLMDSKRFAEVLKNPGLLHSPFTHISEDCGGDHAKEKKMKALEQEFVEKCRKVLFDDTINHIAGISIAHESTKSNDYVSKHHTADYMQSEQRYQVVLNNTSALKGKNFVTDDVIFHKDEDQIKDFSKRKTPYWGIKGSGKSFIRALTVGGVIGYQVIRVVHSHKKLINAFARLEQVKAQDEEEEALM